VPCLTCRVSDNELEMARDQALEAARLLRRTGFDVTDVSDLSPPGLSMHEGGTARMGLDSKTSILNSHGRCWTVPNLFVTDGIAVHAYGSMADMDRIMSIARHHNLKVIEDCAHMHSGTWNGQGVGSLGNVGSFSFQMRKTMSSGEGGICITRDPELAERIFRIKQIGYVVPMASARRSTARSRSWSSRIVNP
jgi:hypothetical protein